MTELPPPGHIKAIVSDFIGVLTTPIAGIFTQFQEDLGLSLTAVRTRKARHHADERLAASIFVPAAGADGAAADGAPRLRATAAAEAYLSTTTDAEGRQRRASVDLYEGAEDDWARRAAGQVLCGTSLDLGRLRLDCAFFVWAMAGRRGIGRYDVLRLAG